MTMEAPGTYHHSLLVANLAESGAKAIGLDATACRVMAYFHDIGKIIKPEYFTENIPPGANPHENLTPSMSALIIIAHVKEGIDLALKYRLKKQVLDAIQQHHGDSVVTYFHQRALQQQQDAREGGKIMNMREEDVPDVSENSFRYPGPKPQTKEIAPAQHRRRGRGGLALPGKTDRPAHRGPGQRDRRAQDRHRPARRMPPHHERNSRGGGGDVRHAEKHDAHPHLLREKGETECEYGCQTNKAKCRCGSVRFCGGLRRRCRCFPAPCRRTSPRFDFVLVDRATMARVHGDFLGDPDRDRRHHLSLRRNPRLPRRGARSGARRYGLEVEQEVLLYALHGLLHLAGYDDTTPASAKEMAAAQSSLLKQILAG